MAKKKNPPANPKSQPSKKQTGEYRHAETAPARPDVGVQPQFRRKLPPKTYRYDSSLAPALDWDGQNAAREQGEALIRVISEAKTLDEAKAIAATLNAHLAADGLNIEVRDAARWYLRIPADEMPETTALWKISGGSVFEHLPKNSGGKINWRALQNELQMLLNDHPVNTAREARGELPINGIWFWGGGSFQTVRSTIKPANPARMLGVQNARNEIRPPSLSAPPKNPHRHELVVAKLALARGLAMNGKLPLNDLPSNYAAMPFNATNTLVVLHGATRALRANSQHDWMQAAAALDRDWFLPTLAAFESKTITSLSLLLPNEHATLKAELAPAPRFDLFRQVSRLFKSTAKPLADYLPHG